jgi:hypothetical protein
LCLPRTFCVSPERLKMCPRVNFSLVVPVRPVGFASSRPRFARSFVSPGSFRLVRFRLVRFAFFVSAFCERGRNERVETNEAKRTRRKRTMRNEQGETNEAETKEAKRTRRNERTSETRTRRGETNETTGKTDETLTQENIFQTLRTDTESAGEAQTRPNTTHSSGAIWGLKGP